MLKKISLVAIILICLVGCSENKVVNGIEIKISKIKDFNVSMTGIGGDYYIPAFSEGFLEVQNNSQQKGQGTAKVSCPRLILGEVIRFRRTWRRSSGNIRFTFRLCGTRLLVARYL